MPPFHQIVARLMAQDTSGDYVYLQTDANKYLKVNVAAGSTGATEYNIDDASAFAGTGPLALGIRKDEDGSIVGASGDFAPLQFDGYGNLRTTGAAAAATFNAEKDEDAGHSSGDTGVYILGVRSDEPLSGSPVSAEADYISLLTNKFGFLHVQDRYSSTISGTLTDIKTAVEIMDDWDDGANNANVAINVDNVGLATDSVLQDVRTALQIMDDWDESDRCKVNPIAGQAGVAADSGAADALTQRVILATDDPAVTALETLDDIVKAEDAAHTSGDNGIMALGIRKDEPESLASDSLDYTLFQFDSLGNARTSSYVTGDVAHDSADAGNPVKVGGVARTSNPTAVASGDRVDSFHDDVGRQVMTPYQVRDLVSTATVTIGTNNADCTTLLASGGAGVYHDVVHVFASNSSTGAVSIFFCGVDSTSDGRGTAMFQLEVPANGTAGFVPAVPVPQDDADAAWVVDWDTNSNIDDRRDVTNTTVRVSALFVKNV